MLRKVKNIFKKPMTLVTIIGVACVPALYNISFLTSMWDPYGRLDQLPVAVINQDQLASFQDKTLTIGDDMVDNMKESKVWISTLYQKRMRRKAWKKGTIIWSSLYQKIYQKKQPVS